MIIYPIIVYPALTSGSWEVSVDGNSITYEYDYGETLKGEQLKSVKESFSDAMDESDEDFKGLITKLKKQSGISGITLTVKFLDEENHVLFSREF